MVWLACRESSGNRHWVSARLEEGVTWLTTHQETRARVRFSIDTVHTSDEETVGKRGSGKLLTEVFDMCRKAIGPDKWVPAVSSLPDYATGRLP
jgi:hypothetical protein